MFKQYYLQLFISIQSFVFHIACCSQGYRVTLSKSGLFQQRQNQQNYESEEVVLSLFSKAGWEDTIAWRSIGSLSAHFIQTF